MKKTLLLVLTLLLMTGYVYGEEVVNVRVNDTLLDLDGGAVIVDGSTMIPVRAVVDVLGADDVQWDGMSQQVTITYGEDTMDMGIGVSAYMYNGEIRELEAAPIIVEGQTMVPVRLIAEAMDCTVDWHGPTRTVLIEKEGIEVAENYQASPEAYAAIEALYTEDDVLWLSRIVHVEGLDIGYEAKLAIANVVLNRVKSAEYPNSVYEVVMDTGYAVQFPPAHKAGFSNLEPKEESVQAAIDALSGNNNILNCLYFNNRPFKWKADELYKEIEGEYFYY